MNKFPFTSTQWQELEHQALIFKYMVSGIPIPQDLLFTIKRSFLDPNNNTPSKLLLSHHHPQHVGWNCFQMGLGRKVDPEPGRCRRTDGKKWRCSKEAFPESKYCERHMHRGKNRSRKPVEVFKTTLTTTTNNSSLSPSINNINTNNSNNNLHYYPYNNNNNNGEVNAQAVDQNNSSFPYHSQYHTTSSSSTSSSRPNNSTTTSLLFDSDVRNGYVYNGLKEEVDEHSFFSEEPSRTLRNQFSRADDSWQLTPLTISCSSSKYSHEKQDYHHHDRCERREDESQKTIHFFDEWPVKEKNSWLDLDDKSSTNTTTQLSISMPKTSYDFPIFTSRARNGD